MAEQTNQNTDQAVIPDKSVEQLVLSSGDILTQVKTYMANADVSLAKIDQNIETLTKQLNDHQRMRLMVLGQRELVQDLYNKMTGSGQQEQQ